MNDKEYWTNYYADNSKPADASTFAEFILPYLDENKDLIELGCGNARDSIFFSKNNINVMAVDQVQSEIDFLNEHYKSDNIHFFCDDFTDLKNTEHDQIKENDFDYVYSRFTFHSINERKEDNALDWIKDNLKNGGLFLLEARSLNDPMFKQGEALSETENFTTHYRRYMDLDKITKKLEDRNFSIEYKIEDNNLAVHKDDNPYVIRIVAKKL